MKTHSFLGTDYTDLHGSLCCKKIKRTIYLLTQSVIQSEAKNLGNIMASVNVNVHEILPPFGRLTS